MGQILIHKASLLFLLSFLFTLGAFLFLFWQLLLLTPMLRTSNADVGLGWPERDWAVCTHEFLGHQVLLEIIKKNHPVIRSGKEQGKVQGVLLFYYYYYFFEGFYSDYVLTSIS